MAGWVYSVARAVRVVGGCVNRAAVYNTTRDRDCAKSNLQTPPPACRSSQNVVKMPVDAGVLFRLRNITEVMFLVPNVGFPPDVQTDPCQHNRETVNRSISTVIIQGLNHGSQYQQQRATFRLRPRRA